MGSVPTVQCKHWKTQKVDVRVVREMYGVMTAERASGAIIITSGLFTQDVRIFAEDKPIDLVEGYQLSDLIRSESNLRAGLICCREHGIRQPLLERLVVAELLEQLGVVLQQLPS